MPAWDMHMLVMLPAACHDRPSFVLYTYSMTPMGVEPGTRIPGFYQHISCAGGARCGGRRRCQSAIGCKTIAKDVTGSGKSTKDVIALIQAS